MDLRRDWKGIASGVATTITTFWAIQEIAKNYGVVITMPTNYLLVLAFVGLTAFPLWVGYQITMWRVNRSLIPLSPSKADDTQQSYDAALLFEITSSTDWFGVGVVDSKGVKVGEFKASEDADVHYREIPDPNLSYFRVDERRASDTKTKVFVSAGFDMVRPSGHQIIFLRKGDMGNLKVEVFNENRRRLGEYEYRGRPNERWNYCEFELKRK
jgi:hypothetical protein